VLPRNTGTQADADFGAVQSLADAALPEKQQSLLQAQAGDLIFIPGHVMLVLGQEQGETFVIHDVAGLHYFKADGSYYDSRLNGVSITPLSPLQRNQHQSYIDGIYMLKSLSREFYAD
jgi:cell wall-associated NlpC family hydrolase